MMCLCVRTLILKDPLKFLLGTFWLWRPNSLFPPSSSSMSVPFPKLHQTRSEAWYQLIKYISLSLFLTKQIRHVLFYVMLFYLGQRVTFHRHHQRTSPYCLVWSLCWLKVHIPNQEFNLNSVHIITHCSVKVQVKKHIFVVLYTADASRHLKWSFLLIKRSSEELIHRTPFLLLMFILQVTNS